MNEEVISQFSQFNKKFTILVYKLGIKTLEYMHCNICCESLFIFFFRMDELTWTQVVDIFVECKKSRFHPPNWEEVEKSIAASLNVENDSKLHDVLLPLRSKYLKLQKQEKGKHSGERVTTDNTVVLKRRDLNIISEEPPKKRKSKSLTDLTSSKQLRRHTDKLWDDVCTFSRNEGQDEWRILGLLLTRCQNQKAREFGNHLWNDPDSAAQLQVPIDTAMAILVDSSLGRQTYSNQRKILKSVGHDILPPWIHLRNEQTKITPEPQRLPDPHVGVHFPLIQSTKITAQRIFQDIPDSTIPDSKSLIMNIKFGFDGSGSHAIYHQLNNEKTNNIILTMFCPLSISSEDGSVILWEQPSPNNPLTHRPLSLQMGKESAESLKSLEIFNDDISTLKDTGFNFETVADQDVTMKVHIKSHMMDMKAAHLYLGLGGAYCDLCNFSKEQCLDPGQIEMGFEITRDIDSLQNVFNDLVQDDGSILKRRNDYDERGGQTTKPIPTNEVLSVQVLRALLRTFNHYMKTAVHLRAGVFDWSESPTSINKQFLTTAKGQI